MVASRCFLPNCRRSLTETGRHKLPNATKQKTQWVTSIKRAFPDIRLVTSAYICSVHFSSKHKFSGKDGKIKLQQQAVPVYFPTNPSLTKHAVFKTERAGFKFKNEEEEEENVDCPFLNTLSMTLKARWIHSKEKAGFKTDEDFLLFLLDHIQCFEQHFTKPAKASDEKPNTENHRDHDYLVSSFEEMLEPKITISEINIPTIKEEPVGDFVETVYGEEFRSDAMRTDCPDPFELEVKSTMDIISTQSGLAADPTEDVDSIPSVNSKSVHKKIVKKEPRPKTSKITRKKKLPKKQPRHKPDIPIENRQTDSCLVQIPPERNTNATENLKRVTGRRGTTRVLFCPMCNFEEASKTLLNIEHARSHLQDMTAPDGSCSMCSLRFENSLDHFWTHAMTGSTCDVCKVLFPNTTLCMVHECGDKIGGCLLIDGSSSEIPPDLVSIYKIVTTVGPNNKKKTSTVYKCLLCLSPFDTIQHVNRHLIRKHVERMKPGYSCSICGKLFWYRNHINLHEITAHHIGEKKCARCNIVLPSKLYYNHMKAHLPKHMCDLCGKELSSATKLRHHKMIHSNTKAFGCEYCEKTFIQKINRDQHQRLHTGEKRYQCTFCKMEFIQSSNYVQHLRKHTKKRARDSLKEGLQDV